jgi:hypothetical protein
MSLLDVVLTLIAIGVGWWLLNKYGAQVIDATMIKIINIVIVVGVVMWLLYLTGLFARLSRVQFPRLG